MGGTQLNAADELDEDAALGISFKVPSLVSNYQPMPSVMQPTTPASGASSFWNPINSLVDMWNNRPQAVKNIRVRVNPTKVVQAAQRVLPPGQVNQAVEYARRMGIDPTFLTQAGEVPITGNMAEGVYRGEGIDWQTYLPWIAGGAAAFVLLPHILGRR